MAWGRSYDRWDKPWAKERGGIGGLVDPDSRWVPLCTGRGRMTRSVHYAIGVGSNLADRAASITAGHDLLVDSGLLEVRARSRLIETEAVLAVGGPAQPSYLNGAWIVATDLGPHQLLHLLQAIETRCGRTRTRPWGPRHLDLDLLMRADSLVVQSGVLTLPHPHLHMRRFVLEPLAEIAGDWRHPLLGREIQALLADLDRHDGPGGGGL